MQSAGANGFASRQPKIEAKLSNETSVTITHSYENLLPVSATGSLEKR